MGKSCFILKSLSISKCTFSDDKHILKEMLFSLHQVHEVIILLWWVNLPEPVWEAYPPNPVGLREQNMNSIHMKML